MKTMTVEEFNETMDKQGIPMADVLFVCPRCKTEQSANQLIAAGVQRDEVAKYIGFSCIGRFDESMGCNWTLGGLFGIHELEIIDPDGKHYPRFMFAEHKKKVH